MSAGTDVAGVLAELTDEELRHVLAAWAIAAEAEPRQPVEVDAETIELWRDRHPPKPALGAFPQLDPEAFADPVTTREQQDPAAALEAASYEAARLAPAPTAVKAGLLLAGELGLDEDSAAPLIRAGVARARREMRHVR